MIEIFESFSPEETKEIGRRLSMEAKPSDIICLNGDLGTGKTVFTKGFAEGLEITDVVSSPTFTILQEYEGGKLPLYHFDVYRIEEPEEMYEVGFSDYFYGDGICLIEWSDLISELIPEHAVYVTIEKVPERGDDYRRIQVKKP